MSNVSLVVGIALAMLASVMVILVPLGLSWWRQFWTIGGPYPVAGVMGRLGILPGSAVGYEFDLAVAAARCIECDAKQRCAEWLLSGRQEGIEAFCRNAATVCTRNYSPPPDGSAPGDEALDIVET